MKIYIVIIINFYCLSLQAINRYVAKTGNNNNAGTYSAPFLTIQKAADIVQPGDTVIVRDGVYSSTISNYGSEIAVVRLVRSGNSSAWITFRAENKGKAIIDGASYDADHGFMIDNGASYIKVEGFEIKDMSTYGIVASTGNHNLEIRNNHIHNIGRICATRKEGLCAINLLKADNILIERNLIHDIGRVSPTEGCPASLYYVWNDHGIYINGVNNCIIKYNIFYNVFHGWPLHFYSGSNYSSSNISVLNNTLAFNKTAAGLIVLYAKLTNVNIQNNLLYLSDEAKLEGLTSSNNSGININADYTYSGIYINHNMMYNGNGIIAKATSGVTITNNIVNTNPQLYSPTTFDFRLKTTSPAINTGVYVGYETDYLGNEINALPDIGAFEYLSSGISITSPASDAIFKAPASVTLNASSNGVAGTIAKVDFYYGSSLLGSDNTSPYSYTLANVPVGSYTITAKATDNTGASATSTPVTFTVVSSQSPVVSITSPASGTNFNPPATITINASASDPGGTITKVDFYADNTFLASDNASPYSYTITNILPGNYSITAKATNYSGASTTSTPVTFTVGPTNQLPVVAITTPVLGTIFPSPATVTITASASDAGGTITKVDFYNGSTLLTSDYSNPFTYTATGVTTGSYTVTAKATDNLGVSTTSAPVTIVVGANKPPVVAITSPVSGTISPANSSITISASATDPDGTISEVDFYSGGNIIGSDFTSPYSFTRTNVSAGSYSITAKAIDNTGASTTSTPVIVNLSTLKSGILEASTSENPVNEIQAESGNLVCYPVPLTNELNIKFIPVEGENVKAIEIYDGTGKYITNSSRLDTHIVMQLAYLIPGIYIIKVRTNKKTYNKLVMKN